MSSEGTSLVGGTLPGGAGEALNLDASGNLLEKVAAGGGGGTTSATGNMTNDGDTVAIALTVSQETALVQILGTFTLTVLFEASPDGGTTWYGVSGVQGTGTVASSTTATGYWRVNIAGFTHFRVRAHPVTSGTANITIQLSQGLNTVSVANATTLGQQTS